ncbi:recombinase family protein [Actinoplanes sp. CA-252034]|uniref:recombinase family protein n=1 Tax=Actinoplanes sp. CA-252034 TaxID=3239906 RepID=UPI003D961219
MDSPAASPDPVAPSDTAVPRRRRGRHARHDRGDIRFAFYGRMSTGDFQDHATSYQWQFDCASQLIAGHGRIVVDFFDVGCPRSLDWHLRPQAGALLAEVADAARVFDAIVVGEFERAFYGGQLQALLPVFGAHGVQMWLPEAGGPVEADSPVHQALMLMLGHQSQREILRSRLRASAAMAAQTREQGRFLGGRPPYGYRIVDAGPHPNAVHAGWGRRLHRLDLDPVTAPHVRWIFDLRLGGESTPGIARTLNAAGVVPPSAHDRARNPHRSGREWTVRTVAAILANPRYTGREVWNRQRTDHHDTTLGAHGGRSPGRKPTRRWNPADEWIFSRKVTHPPLVSETDFLQVQRVSALLKPADGIERRYVLTGLVICGLCGRRAEGHWSKGLARYRCRHGHNSGSAAEPGRPKILYVREDVLLEKTTIAFANLERRDVSSFPPGVFAACLRRRNIVIVCTPVSVTLDLSTDESGGPGCQTRARPPSESGASRAGVVPDQRSSLMDAQPAW